MVQVGFGLVGCDRMGQKPDGGGVVTPEQRLATLLEEFLGRGRLGLVCCGGRGGRVWPARQHRCRQHDQDDPVFVHSLCSWWVRGPFTGGRS